MLTLKNLKTFLKEKQTVTMRELQLHYKEDPQLIYQMLKHFICRGQLTQCKVTPKCGSKCHQCNPIYTIKFNWLMI